MQSLPSDSCRKNIERDSKSCTYCAFVVLEEAYDRVPKKELALCMHNKVVSEKYIRLVKDVYHQCETSENVY